MTGLKAYVAGPLFVEGERYWIGTVERLVAEEGFVTFLPHRHNPPKDEFNVRQIFDNDRRGIDECDVVVANLNGIITDDGTAWELGYAFAKDKHLIGMHTDWRRRFDHEVVNLMLECSLHRMVHSLDELRVALRGFAAR
jgi:nucleoside 2-deoxyribosyltransferase